MSYAIRRSEHPADAVRRIAHEEVGAALHALAHTDELGVEEAIHDVRKRCKQLRGLIRLVPRELGKEYRRANDTFRDAARELSVIRDAQALLATFDEMVEAANAQLPDDEGLAAVRAGLAHRAERAHAEVAGRSANIERAAELLAAGEARIDRWSVTSDGWEAFAAGLGTTYDRGRRALAAAHEAPTAEAFHEWRKRAKYGWYHTRLLAPMAPSVLDPLAQRFHDLSDALGDAHDLAVLTDQLAADPDHFGGADAVVAAGEVVDAHRSDLEHRAVSLGSRLYVEPPKRYVARMGGYWDLWHHLGDELAAGEMAALHAAAVAAGA
jgi:CHAD domain-containing protein